MIAVAPVAQSCLQKLSVLSWVWVHGTAALTWFCTEAQTWPNLEVLCVFLTPCFSHHSSKYWSSLSKLFLCQCCSLLAGGLPILWAVRAVQVLGAVCGLGAWIPQECGIRTRPRLECCSQPSRVWVMWESVLLLSGWAQTSSEPDGAFCFHHVGTFLFLFSSLLAWISKQRAEVSTSCLFSHISILPALLGSRTEIPRCDWGSHCH